MLQVILNTKNRWDFFQKRIANTNQNEFRVEIVTKKKGDKLYVKWIVLLTFGLIKRQSINEWIFSRTERVKVELDMSN